METHERSRVAREEWAKRVERWRDSGLSCAEFAAELGINARTLTYWKWMLNKEARGEKRAWPARKTRAPRVPRPAASEAPRSAVRPAGWIASSAIRKVQHAIHRDGCVCFAYPRGVTAEPAPELALAAICLAISAQSSPG